MSPTVAAIDLGSNSVKLLVATMRDGALVVLEDRAEITRISEAAGLGGTVGSVPMERTFRALQSMAEDARSHEAHIRAVATAGLRGVKNADEFLARVERELGFRIEIIDGDREAELTFAAPAAAYGKQTTIVVVDIGGRSTELVVGTDQGADARASLTMGGVGLLESFVRSDPPSEDELRACRAHVRQLLRQSAPPCASAKKLIGVSGTIVALYGHARGLQSMSDVVRAAEGDTLSKAELQASFSTLASVTQDRRIFGDVIPKGRADVIVCGALIALEVMEHYGAEAMGVSSRGVRYGLAIEALQGR